MAVVVLACGCGHVGYDDLLAPDGSTPDAQTGGGSSTSGSNASSGTDAVVHQGADASGGHHSSDATTHADASDAGARPDATIDSGTGHDAGRDASSRDAARDARRDAENDAERDAKKDAGRDAERDAKKDAERDAAKDAGQLTDGGVNTCPTYAPTAGDSCTDYGELCSYKTASCTCSYGSPPQGMLRWVCESLPEGCPEEAPAPDAGCMARGLICNYGACLGSSEVACGDASTWVLQTVTCPE
jgi:hypothetical protein